MLNLVYVVGRRLDMGRLLKVKTKNRTNIVYFSSSNSIKSSYHLKKKTTNFLKAGNGKMTLLHVLISSFLLACKQVASLRKIVLAVPF